MRSVGVLRIISGHLFLFVMSPVALRHVVHLDSSLSPCRRYLDISQPINHFVPIGLFLSHVDNGLPTHCPAARNQNQTSLRFSHQLPWPRRSPPHQNHRQKPTVFSHNHLPPSYLRNTGEMDATSPSTGTNGRLRHRLDAHLRAHHRQDRALPPPSGIPRPASPPRNRWVPSCNHTTMAIIYADTFKCMSCRQESPLGILYRCIVDKEPLILEEKNRDFPVSQPKATATGSY